MIANSTTLDADVAHNRINHAVQDMLDLGHTMTDIDASKVRMFGTSQALRLVHPDRSLVLFRELYNGGTFFPYHSSSYVKSCPSPL